MQYSMTFLRQLYSQKNLIKHARIEALTLDELPLEMLEGRITQGSINVDGASAIRRTCSLTMVAPNFQYNQYYWTLNTKFRLWIGLENHIDPTYEDIIWFKQGIFVLTSFNTSRSTNNFTISLSGKDKMCLLNGEVGGSIESSVDFGTIEEEDPEGNWIIRKLPLYEIIRNAVHVYGHEPYHNIIIKDLETYGLELLEYRYDEPLYLVRAEGENNYFNAYFDKACTVDGKSLNLSAVEPQHFEILLENGQDTLGSIFTFPSAENLECRVAKIEYGDVAGYRLTDLVYAGDLVVNAGDSITSMLDKIRNMLVEFEYFYDVDGRFTFQKKPSFTSAIWSFPVDNTAAAPPSIEDYAYEFTDLIMFTSLGYTPNILNLRNDYSVWGERATLAGATVPIHLRYAIDTKPTQYTSITVSDKEVENYNIEHGTTLKGQTSILYTVANYDWREIIYRMALDYYKYNFLDDFELRVAKANMLSPDTNESLYPEGHTGYEQYYTDLQGFWRELYNADVETQNTELTNEIYQLNSDLAVAETNVAAQKSTILNSKNEIVAAQKTLEECLIKQLTLNQGKNKWEQLIRLKAEILEVQLEIYEITSKENQTEEDVRRLEELGIINNELNSKQVLLEQEVIALLGENYMSIDFEQELEQIEKDIEAQKKIIYNAQFALSEAENTLATLETEVESITTNRQSSVTKQEQLLTTYYRDNQNHKYWNRAVYEQPDTLNFWFDFLEANQGTLYQNSVKAIGNRPKVVNDSSVKSIYYRDTPNVIYNSEIKEENQGNFGDYKTIQIPNMDEMFSISAQGKSAKTRLDELLYQHFYCVENASITSIPLYHLQPNSRILIDDDETGLHGDYIVSKLTIPLAYNGTMSITATKAND